MAVPVHLVCWDEPGRPKCSWGISQWGCGEILKNSCSPLYWPELPYISCLMKQYVFCLQKCLLVTSGIVITATFSIQFIDKNLRWYLYVWSAIFIFWRIISVLQNSILLEYCSILQNKHLADTKSIENSN